MALKFSQAIGSQEQLYSVLAKKSKLFSEQDLSEAASIGNGDIYNALIAGSSGLTSSTFNDEYYKRFNIEDKLSYLNYSFYETDPEKQKKYKEYFDYQYDKAIDEETYSQLNDFQRFFRSIGGIVGNAMNDLFVGTTEGLIDATGWLAYSLSGDEDIKSFIAKDTTGYSKNREDLQRFIRANTYLDKNGFWKVTNEVVDSIAKMTPMFVGTALAPFTGGFSAVAGQMVYFGSMAGNTAEDAIRANPDISRSNLFWYTAAVTGVELATEKLSALIFPSATDVAAGMGSASKRAAVGNIFARLGLDFASEFTEEFVSEFVDSVLYNALVDQSKEVASFTDCLYAGLIGGLTGALMAGGEVMLTKQGYVTADGELISWSEAKKQGLTDGTKLSKIQTLNLKEHIQAAREAGSKSYVTDLQNKYKNETLDSIKQNHEKEYNRAVEKDAKYKENLAKTTLALSKILSDIGVDNFNKAVDLANSTYEDIQRTANNYTDKLTGKTAFDRKVESSFNETFGPEGDSFAISEGLTLREQQLQNELAKNGIYVHFGKIGNKNHLTQNYRVLGNQIYLDSESTANMSLDSILNKVINNALSDQCVDLLNALPEKEAQQLYKDISKTMGLPGLKVDENFKKSIAERLLFDEKTISQSMITNHSITDKVYNLLHKQKNLMDHQKTFNKKDKTRYNKLLKIMETYRNVLASEIGNNTDLELAKQNMELSAEEALDVENKYIPDFTTSHYTWLRENHTLNTYNRKQATRFLLNNRVTKDANTSIDFDNVFDSTPNKYYTEAFINQIQSRNPSESFAYNLNEYLISTYNMVIQQRAGCLTEVVDYSQITNNEFADSLELLTLNPNALEGFENLEQIFTKKFTKKFQRVDGTNELADVRLKFVVKENIGVTKSKYELNSYELINGLRVPMGPTITVFVKPKMSLNDAAVLRHEVFHEATHALSDLQGLPNGTNSKYVKQSLTELNNDAVLHSLARELLTDEFYQENKNNKQELINNVAYQIYSITDGEFAAEAYIGSKVRQGDLNINLMAGSAMNKSGFLVNADGQIVGYGKFNKIVLPAPKNEQIQGDYTSKAFKNAAEITATKEETESTVGKMAPIDILNNNFKKWVNAKSDTFKNHFAKDYLNQISGINVEFDTKTGKVAVDEDGDSKISHSDTFLEQGFSKDFYRAVLNNNFSKEGLKDLLEPSDEYGMVSKIGNEQRTNEIISLLYPDNVNITNYADLTKLLQTEKGINGLAYAIAYDQVSSSNKQEAHSLEEIKQFFKEHSEYDIRKLELKDYAKKDADSKKMSLVEKVNDLIKGHPSIYKYLLNIDFNYSRSSAEKALKELEARSENKTSKVESVSSFGEEGSENEEGFQFVDETTGKDVIEEDLESQIESKKTGLTPEANAFVKQITEAETPKQAFKFIENVMERKEQVKEVLGESYDYIEKTYLKTEAEFKKEISQLKNKLDKFELSANEKTNVSDLLSSLEFPDDYALAVERLTSLVKQKEKTGTLKETQNSLKDQKSTLSYGRKATNDEIKNINKTQFFRGDNTAGLTEFDNTKGEKKRYVPGVVWLTSNRYAASTYARKSETSRIYTANVEVKNPLVVDFKGNVWSKGVDGKTTDQIVLEAKAAGYDSVIFENVVDIGPNYHKVSDKNNVLRQSTNIAVFEKSSVKVTEESDIVNSDEYYKPKTQEVIESEKIVKESNTTSKDSDAIADKIINIIENSNLEESEAQGFDKATETKYKVLSSKMLAENAALFAAINDSNYDAVYNKVKGNPQALILFNLYTTTMLGKFSPEIQEKISNNSRKQVTYSAETMALQEHRIAEAKPISHAISGLVKEGITANVSDETLAKIFPELKEKDAKIGELTKQIEELNEKIIQLSDKNAEQAEELLTKQKELSDEKQVLTNGSNADIADFELNKMADQGIEGADKAARLSSKMLEDILAQAKIADENGKKVKLVTIKNGEPVAFPEAMKKLYKVMDNLKSFRMWAMLSSPVTWIRNWTGNQGMRVLEKFTNGLERVFAKDMSDSEFEELQTKYKETNKKFEPLREERAKLKQAVTTAKANITRIKNNLNNVVTESKKSEHEAELTVAEKALSKAEKAYDAWKESNIENFEKINKERKGIEFEMHQRNLNLEKASSDTRQWIKENFSARIDQDLHRKGGKYALTADEKTTQARNMRLDALKIKMKNEKGFKKFVAWAQYIENYALEESVLGDIPILKKSALENLANMTESNKTYFRRVLQEQLKATTDPAKKAKIQDAINSNDASKMLDLLPEEADVLLHKAEDLAAEQYFKNSNVLSRWLNEIGKKNRALGFITSLILPFPKVAGNILSMAYKYSPLGFVKGLKQWGQIRQYKAGNYENFTGFEKAELNKTLSRATVGSIMFLAGAILSALGLIDIDEDDYLGPSLKLGDFKISLSNLAPSMTTFSTAAAITWAAKNNKNAVNQALDTLYDNTLLGNVENIFKYGSIENWAKTMPISWLGQYVPAVLKLITKSMTDGNTKDKNSSNYLVKVARTLGSYIPGVSNLVPNKINPYTGKAVRASGTENWLSNFLMNLSPLTMKYTKESDIEKEAKRLNTKTTGLSGNFTINGVDYKLDNKETLAKYRAKYINNRFADIKSGKEKITVKDKKTNKYKTTTYDNLSDEEKSTVLKRIYDDATSYAKIEYWTSLNKNNYYIVTDKNDLKEYRKLISNSSQIVYKNKWDKSKFITK